MESEGAAGAADRYELRINSGVVQLSLDTLRATRRHRPATTVETRPDVSRGRSGHPAGWRPEPPERNFLTARITRLNSRRVVAVLAALAVLVLR